MPVRHPRRIFRHSPGRRSSGPVLLALATLLAVPVLVLVATAWLQAMPSPAAATSAAAPGSVIEAGPQQVAVVDGNTLRLRDVVVHLKGVVVPVRTACASAETTDCGTGAITTLASLVSQGSVRCSLSGRDGAGRPLGRCDADAVPLNRAVVARGWARADPRDPWLAPAEAEAKAAHRGLWASH